MFIMQYQNLSGVLREIVCFWTTTFGSINTLFNKKDLFAYIIIGSSSRAFGERQFSHQALSVQKYSQSRQGLVSMAPERADGMESMQLSEMQKLSSVSNLPLAPRST